MAKGNLFLGTAAKSVGDVVMYRRDGSQVSRVRVRKIANPKTDAQCKQRAIMAPIPKFYSPLAIMLERSFEGLSKSKSYSKFLKVNADKARANDWLLPKGKGFFPLPYELSQGTLPAFSYAYDGPSGAWKIDQINASTEPTTVGDLSTLFVNAGYQPGDVITIISVNALSATMNANFVPESKQFKIDTTSDATLADTLTGFAFSVVSNKLAIKTPDSSFSAFAIIAARFENEKWRRSSQALAVLTSLMEDVTDNANKTAAIESYRGTIDGGNPLVYLDGDELQ